MNLLVTSIGNKMVLLLMGLRSSNHICYRFLFYGRIRNGLASAEVANPQNLYLKPLDKFSGEFSFLFLIINWIISSF